MKIDRTKGAQVGNSNVQNNTYLPPSAGARRDSPSASVTAGDHANITQKNTQLKFSLPVIGPLFSLASAHPVIAGVAAVAVIAGGGVATTVALSTPKTSPSAALVRGFAMKSTSQGAPTGYDFSHTPPVVADTHTDAIYVSNTSLVSTNGKLASWTSPKLPTASDCRNLVAEHPVRSAAFGIQSVVCYLDRNGDPGYISVTAYDSETTTIDTAHLR